ncbi:head protein [Cereibacter sphaeroides]|uniref:Mu-like prophage major head subunit gpT family protein n=1 Tax=Cereibacter sphaeroides TaxID=1063 RepID=UPI000F53B095|nr:Mu-like prophage major head subunit gpT family protein [Cereibacter sphaeroides]AZB57253.1 head protein [Cereibacter sphaeroides]AZB61537.1 head protein [Cereibacter sphaeroides]
MAIITAAILAALNTGVKKNFQDGYDQMRAAAFWDQVATLVPSSTASNTYGWLGDFPKLREWVGDRVVKDMKASGYSIENKLFEATLGVQRTQIEDDQYGHYAPIAKSMGQEAAQHPDRLVQAVIGAGDTALCFDGQNFFDTDHPVYVNEDGTGAVTTVANTVAGAGAPWFLLDCSKVLKPFIFQERTKPELEMKFDPSTSDTVFTKDLYQWGIRYRCNAGYGFWQLARRSQESLDAAAFEAGRTAMRSLKGDGGRPLGIVPNILLVPPALESAADAIVNVRTLPGGGDNPNFGKAKVIVMDWA